MTIKSIYSHSKIRNKLFLIFSSILMVYCVLGLVIMHFVSDAYDRNLYSEAANELNLSSSTVNNELHNIEDFSFREMTDGSLQGYLGSIQNNPSDYNASLAKTYLNQRVTENFDQLKFANYIQITAADGTKFMAGKNGPINDLSANELDLIQSAQGGHVWLNDANHPNVLVSARQIRDKTNVRLTNLGVLQIQVNLDELVRTYLSLSAGKNFMVYKDKQVVYSSNSALSMAMTKMTPAAAQNYSIIYINNQNYFVTQLDTNYEGFRFYNMIPFNTLFQQVLILRTEMIGIYVFLLLVSLFVIRKLARRISSPLENLIMQMKEVQSGNLQLSDEAIGQPVNMDEIGELYVNFKLMLKKINELIQENYVKQLVIKETEFQALQAQINPHFLYNTLNSINWMAKINQQQTISEMVEALGNLFRSMMNRRESLITIDEELILTQNYLTIQKIRFGDRLQFYLSIDEKFKKYIIPKLSIQPLVENVIKHGLEQMVNDCYISINCIGNKDSIEISVSDNGPGMDQQTIDDILTGKGTQKVSKIGLMSINSRIQMLFGDPFGISIHSDEMKGTKVTLHLPYKVTERSD
ncbi:MAG: sensor histidine kinase [Bacilli bacterium]|nr:sensor histidine kinase [Bacilli bacterium]